VLFANFAEAMAEGRGKAQADTLRKAKTETVANRERPDGTSSACRRRRCARATSSAWRRRSHSGDGEIIEGVASVDESAITGESAP
jgi:K+-transporting ATPase ATPase B chain